MRFKLALLLCLLPFCSFSQVIVTGGVGAGINSVPRFLKPVDRSGISLASAIGVKYNLAPHLRAGIETGYGKLSTETNTYLTSSTGVQVYPYKYVYHFGKYAVPVLLTGEYVAGGRRTEFVNNHSEISVGFNAGAMLLLGSDNGGSDANSETEHLYYKNTVCFMGGLQVGYTYKIKERIRVGIEVKGEYLSGRFALAGSQSGEEAGSMFYVPVLLKGSYYLWSNSFYK